MDENISFTLCMDRFHVFSLSWVDNIACHWIKRKKSIMAMGGGGNILWKFSLQKFYFLIIDV